MMMDCNCDINRHTRMCTERVALLATDYDLLMEASKRGHGVIGNESMAALSPVQQAEIVRKAEEVSPYSVRFMKKPMTESGLDELVALERIRENYMYMLFIPRQEQTEFIVSVFLYQLLNQPHDTVNSVFCKALHLSFDDPSPHPGITEAHWTRIAEAGYGNFLNWHPQPFSIHSPSAQAAFKRNPCDVLSCVDLEYEHYLAIVRQSGVFFHNIPRKFQTVDLFREAYKSYPRLRVGVSKYMMRQLLGLPEPEAEPTDESADESDDESVLYDSDCCVSSDEDDE